MSASTVIRLRRAQLSDRGLLDAWDRKPHVLAATGRIDEDDHFDWALELPRDVDWREFLIAETTEGRPIGVLQIIDPAREETHYWGECEPDLRAIDIWIGEEDDLGRGYGTQMMGLALSRCFASPAVRAVLVDPLASNTDAHRFYERMGFRPVERRWFGEDDCIVHRIDRPK